MSYEIALDKSWQGVIGLNPPERIEIRFLSDEFSVEAKEKKILSMSCNIPAKDFSAILILHYLAQKLKGLPKLSGEWLTFRELSGIEGYYPAFRKRSIEPIIRKYGDNPAGIFQALEKLPAKKASDAEIGIIVEAFENVPVLIKIWGKDEEFSADANMYFDKSVTSIFCTEDIVVLAGIVVGQL